jgi:uncharacterized protein
MDNRVDFTALPPTAAWAHHTARMGFEVARFERTGSGHRIRGTTTAVEDGDAWAISYDITVDSTWTTRQARAARDDVEFVAAKDDDGEWVINGGTVPGLSDCVDVDFEWSVVTNTLPIHRLRRDPFGPTQVPALYVRAADLSVMRLDQRYAYVASPAGKHLYHYSAPAFDFLAELNFDAAGLITDYPGLARRVR